MWKHSLLLFVLPALSSVALGDTTLFDFSEPFDVSTIATRDAAVKLIKQQGNPALRISTGHSQQWPGITLKPPSASWDLSSFSDIRMDVTNLGTKLVHVSLRVDSPGPDGKGVWTQETTDVPAGQTATVSTRLTRRIPEALKSKLFGMRGYPDGMNLDRGIDPSQVTQLLIFVGEPSEDYSFAVDNIRAAGHQTPPTLTALTVDSLFPMIDEFGQYKHKDWPGKTHSIQELHLRKKEEADDLNQHPGPADWDRYGGWVTGPQLKRTNAFRVEKYKSKWWLVDPDGRLFWSHGIDCVRPTTAYTPITDREHWYQGLPNDDSPFTVFYGRGHGAAHGYYQNRSYRTYNFTGANLLRKYGDDWMARFSDLCHRRLRSWGMNTIANWSDSNIYRHDLTPYVVSISTKRKPIGGSSGYWGKFPDPFDSGFAESLKKRLGIERKQSANDPWCLGYFVDNELSWGDDPSLALATLNSPPDQAAKAVFISDLKRKYGTIEKLNTAWNVQHASWAALKECREAPKKDRAGDDLAAFYTRIAEEYFRVCRDAVKTAAPDRLYLGCRFAWTNDRAIRAAAKYCDVISFNKYRYTVADFTLPDGVDKPAIIGEFHFGALDRGMFHTGLKRTANQAERAATYKSYVEGALDNPYLVGTHWFQFGEQATTGRSDGENYQIGFLDVCDTPYPETIQACREVGYTLYQRRLNGRQNATEKQYGSVD